jgi:hypothetical protein
MTVLRRGPTEWLSKQDAARGGGARVHGGVQILPRRDTLTPLLVRKKDELEAHTFLAPVDRQFAPTLNGEASFYVWVDPKLVDGRGIDAGLEAAMEEESRRSFARSLARGAVFVIDPDFKRPIKPWRRHKAVRSERKPAWLERKEENDAREHRRAATEHLERTLHARRTIVEEGRAAIGHSQFRG